MTERVRVTFSLPKEVVKQFKLEAIREEKNFSQLLEELMKRKLNMK